MYVKISEVIDLIRRYIVKQNYQIILNKTLEKISAENTRPSLLLHACCAPCSSYVLEYLNSYFNITVYFYNPNITDKNEYYKRYAELERLISEIPHDGKITAEDGGMNPSAFFEIAKDLESLPEGGERCFKCYRLRLESAAKAAQIGGYDYFTTTLSISPHKNAAVLNEIGAELAQKYNVNYLFSDFKKKNGYKRSCELSAIYSLYRQDYCGCIYSKLEAEKRRHSADKIKPAGA